MAANGVLNERRVELDWACVVASKFVFQTSGDVHVLIVIAKGPYFMFILVLVILLFSVTVFQRLKRVKSVCNNSHVPGDFAGIRNLKWEL